ncbi:MAG: DUF393 domain-containing protein [Candidatus Omnitrophota bacterium]
MIKVYYDGKCGVCRGEMRHYQRIAPVRVFEWIDIMQKPAPALPAGVSEADALKVLHVADDEGRIHRGLDAFLVIWRAMPGFRWLYRIMSFPGIRQLGRIGYYIFAAVRFRWMGYDRCKVL